MERSSRDFAESAPVASFLAKKCLDAALDAEASCRSSALRRKLFPVTAADAPTVVASTLVVDPCWRPHPLIRPPTSVLCIRRVPYSGMGDSVAEVSVDVFVSAFSVCTKCGAVPRHGVT